MREGCLDVGGITVPGVTSRGVVGGRHLSDGVGEALSLDDGGGGDLAGHFLVLALAHLVVVELIGVAPTDGKLGFSPGFIAASKHGSP